jgi:hypothetical protein
VGVFASRDAARWGHQLPTFAAVESRPGDAEMVAAVVEGCDRLLALTGSAPRPS